MINFTQLGIPKKEFDYFMSQYHGAEYFAAIKAGGECLTPSLFDALKGLYESSLLPLLVHGGGSQIDLALKEKGIISEKIDCMRVTDQKTLEVVVSTLTDVNTKLVSEMNERKVSAKGLNGIFYVDKPHETYGFTGNITGMNHKAVDHCVRARHIPIISSLGKDQAGQDYNSNADSAFKYLVSQLNPKKVIFLTPTGGVFKEEKLISYMRRKELKDFIASDFVNGGMKLKLQEAEALISLGHDVQITSPENLIKELFSETGCGTYLCNK